jgi:hypothetical protein
MFNGNKTYKNFNKSIAIVTIFSFLSASLVPVYAEDAPPESAASKPKLTSSAKDASLADSKQDTTPLDPAKLGKAALPFVKPSLWRGALSAIGFEPKLPTINLSQMGRKLNSTRFKVAVTGITLYNLTAPAAAQVTSSSAGFSAGNLSSTGKSQLEESCWYYQTCQDGTYIATDDGGIALIYIAGAFGFLASYVCCLGPTLKACRLGMEAADR